MVKVAVVRVIVGNEREKERERGVDERREIRSKIKNYLFNEQIVSLPLPPDHAMRGALTASVRARPALSSFTLRSCFSANRGATSS